jgi:S1-C subfamily serine protease
MRRLLLLFLASCASVPGRGRTVDEEFASAAELHVACGDKPDQVINMLHGSAVIVSEHRALTAAHAVECGAHHVTGAMMVLGDGRQVQVEVEAVSTRHDIARLVASESLHAAPVGIGPAPRQGDVVCLITRWPSAAFRCGLVAWTHLQGKMEIFHGATVVAGNSGSALYDHRGLLVGIITHRAYPGGMATFVREWFVDAE